MTNDSTILLGDAKQILSTLGRESIDCIVTSPPYFGLRDYGISGQIGLEQTPESYIEKLVEVFRECRRILKSAGTLWLNIGDSYYNHRPGRGQKLQRQTLASNDQDLPQICPRRNNKFEGLKEKDLIGIPWLLAFAPRADGWYLRQDIIWHKSNAMPESVKDRCTKAHEYLFLLTKSERYYFNHGAIKEPATVGWGGSRFTNDRDLTTHPSTSLKARIESNSRNKRSVWKIPTKPFKDAHFATFPIDLVKPCVLAGSPEDGIVLDPFCGSGTVGVVALNHGRKFIGAELKPEYAEMAKDRINRETASGRV